MKRFMVMMAFALLAGCATPPAPTASQYGPPPQNYEGTIKAYFNAVLKDPESARYQFIPPMRAWGEKGFLRGGGISWIGWRVIVDVNAKNSYGGYTGAKLYHVFFDGDKVSRVIGPDQYAILDYVHPFEG